MSYGLAITSDNLHFNEDQQPIYCDHLAQILPKHLHKLTNCYNFPQVLVQYQNYKINIVDLAF